MPRPTPLPALLLAALASACAAPAPGPMLPAADPSAVRMGPWSAGDVQAWLARHDHGAVGEHSSLLADGRWTADDSRATALQRWSQWWEGRLPSAELQRRVAELGVALDLKPLEPLDPEHASRD